MEKTNELYDSTDILNFGQNKNEKFFWIYRLNIEYFEWLILNTNICFTNLELFYEYGKPIKLDYDSLTEKTKNEIFEITKNNSKNINKNGGNSYLMTINVLDILTDKRIIRTNNFIEIAYEFPKKVTEENNRKLTNSIVCSNINKGSKQIRKNHYTY